MPIIRKKMDPDSCIACEGSGKSSQGFRCHPCNGTGKKRHESKEEVNQTKGYFEAIKASSPKKAGAKKSSQKVVGRGAKKQGTKKASTKKT